MDMLCDSGSPVTVTRPSGAGAESDHAPTESWSVTPRASLASTRTGAAPADPGVGSGAGSSRGTERRPVSAHAVVAPPVYVARRSLPDSVLVRIDGREDITRRRFARAVRLLGGNPDSLTTPADRDRFLELVIEQRLLAARAVRDGR